MQLVSQLPMSERPAPEIIKTSEPAQTMTEEALLAAMLNERGKVDKMSRDGLQRVRKTPYRIIAIDREERILEHLTGRWADYEELAEVAHLAKNSMARVCRNLVECGVLEKKYAPRVGSSPGRALFRKVEGAK